MELHSWIRGNKQLEQENGGINEELSLRARNPPIFWKGRHLSTVLPITEIEYLFQNKENPKALKREHRELLETLEERKVM